MLAGMNGPFVDRLVAGIERTGTPACVGLDPVLERLPVGLHGGEPARALLTFCRSVLDAVADLVPAVKFQSACFERLGPPGLDALWDLQRLADQAGLLVILDAKRGDVPMTAAHYAAMAVAGGAQALTVNAYPGPETVLPYLDAGLGVFVLVRTSNPGSEAVQAQGLADGRTVAEMMADHVATLGRSRMGRCGYSDVGAVVAATTPAEARRLRQRMPDQVFLVPGWGAQGATADDIRPLLSPRHDACRGVLVSASRSVIYAFSPGAGDWTGQVRAAAQRFIADVRAAVR